MISSGLVSIVVGSIFEKRADRARDRLRAAIAIDSFKLLSGEMMRFIESSERNVGKFIGEVKAACSMLAREVTESIGDFSQSIQSEFRAIVESQKNVSESINRMIDHMRKG